MDKCRISLDGIAPLVPENYKGDEVLRVGVPKEIKPDENRVSLTPAGAQALVNAGHEVFVEKGAGVGSGFEDAGYVASGAKVLPDAASVWGTASA